MKSNSYITWCLLYFLLAVTVETAEIPDMPKRVMIPPVDIEQCSQPPDLLYIYLYERLKEVESIEAVDERLKALTGLARPDAPNRVLWIGECKQALHRPNPLPRITPSYDLLRRLNTAAEVPLDDYRFIGIFGGYDGLLKEDTLKAFEKWLRYQPGVLLVQGHLQDDPEAKVNTPSDLEPTLRSRWPWNDDVRRHNDGYMPQSDRVERIGDEQENFLLWRDENYEGMVLFLNGNSEPDLEPIQTVLSKLHGRYSVGLRPVEGHNVLLHENEEVKGITITGNLTEPLRLSGIDILTGIADPVMERGAAVLTESYAGTYVAVKNNVHILCEKKIDELEAVENGLRVRTEGLIQTSSRQGTVYIEVENITLEEVQEEHFVEWLFGEEHGYITRQRPGGNGKVTFIRSPDAAVEITAR